MLLPNSANTIVTIIPRNTPNQSCRLFLESNGVKPPNTAAANVSFAKSKKNEAIFSFLTRSFSSLVILLFLYGICHSLLLHNPSVVDKHQGEGDDGKYAHTDIFELHAAVDEPTEKRRCKVEGTA